MKALTILFLIAIPLLKTFPETLVLKDGKIIKMTLKSQDANNLTYSINGKDFTLPKNKIRRVVYAKTPELEDKIAKEELIKLRKENAKNSKKTNEVVANDNSSLDEEIAKALEEQQRQERMNLSFEERIHKLEDDLFSLKSSSSRDKSEKLSQLEKDIEDLKKRTRRVERFLEIDPDIEDYYSKPRTMWSIIWRSALVPGWGLKYGRNEFSGLYSSLFFLSGFVGLASREGLKSTENSLNDKFINDFIIQPNAVSALFSGSGGTTLIDSYKNYNNFTKLPKYIQARNNYESNVDKSSKVIAFAAGIYALQLVHSAIYGYFWAKQPPKKFYNESSSGWKMHISPVAKRNSITNNQDWQADIGYKFEF